MPTVKSNDLEKFFISSPLGPLEICIRRNRLYSVSRLSQKVLSGIRSKVSKTVDKNLSYFLSSDSKEVIRKKTSLFGCLVKRQIKSYFKYRISLSVDFSIPEIP